MKLVSQENFSSSQKRFIESVKDSVNFISSQTDLVLGIKDIRSRHVIATDAYARLVGLLHGTDVTDRLDRDMPCDGTVQFADCYVREDQELLHHPDFNRKKAVLNVHEYSHGIDALIFEKYLLKHHVSDSIVGIIYTASRIGISKFLSLAPDYIREFGIGCSIEGVSGSLDIESFNLTSYEHEVGFLLAMNWDCAQIAHFMNTHHPTPKPRSQDTIYKCRNRICAKLDCHPTRLRDMLVEMRVHQKMPTSFFRRLIGSTSL
ncbi:helix-turn-helix transcriptional regulator [Paraburkholderia humisilvae]|uniref:Uncharacterized protein n=1 Tax=Paraburkholderia humisilvae TaxID=627669 RepID=A0A6J5ETE6_9BURK|nr:hypothetical protein [Paraburkholderia humisilvae]CAB3769234.1 hypothetical protein LMG29542_06067 [Paraburkholderia humisilvae]